MSESHEQVERDEEQPILEDEPKEAIWQAVKEGYKPPPRSESISHEEEEPDEEEEGGELLDLNDATQKELRSLPGIGPTLAGRITRYREEEGPFREAAEITRVQGISDVTYEAIADQITVGSAPVEEAEAGAEEAAEAEEPAEGEETYVVSLATEEDQLDEALPSPPEEEAAAPERMRPAPPPLAESTRLESTGRGAGWGSLLIVGLLGAFAGALLALLALFLLNGGTLDFERATARAIDREVSQVDAQLMELQAQLDDARQRLGQIGELSQRLDDTQSALAEAESEIGALGGAVEMLQSELSSTTESLADVRQTLAGLSDDLTSVAESVTALDDQVAEVNEQLGELDEQLLALRTVAARFDTFLFGLRGLLEETVPGSVSPGPREQMPTPTPAGPTPRITPTPTPAGSSPTPASQVTVIPLASPTP